MKILLTAVNAKYVHSNLAVYSLRAYAKEYKSNIEICEFTINHYTDDILRKIYEKQPDVIAFSCYIWNILIVKELIAELKKILPEIEIWAGGPEVSYVAKAFLEEYPQVKGIMVGEGEKIFANLAKYYVEGENQCANTDQYQLYDIRGIVYRSGDQVISTGSEEIIDMDSIPFIYEDLKAFENKIIYYESSRGCPFSCSYCLSSIDKQLRFRNLDLVRKELKFFLQSKVKQVKFIDRTFNCKRGHTLEIWEFLLKNDNGVTNFHFEVSADLLGEEELGLIKQMRPGLIQLEIGVQSTNEKTIQEIDRTMDLDKLTKVVTKINSYANTHQHLDLIAGLPYEDLESFKKSFNDIYLMKPEQLQLGFLKLLSGSKMYDHVEDYGIVYKDTRPYEVLYTKWLKYADILFLKGVEEVLEIYYNSGQFTNTLLCLERYFGTPFDLYGQIAEYHKRYTKQGEKYSRITWYEMLLDFISNQESMNNCAEGSERQCGSSHGAIIEAFKNVLTLDVYLRDNIKTRPNFARNIDSFKEIIREIYIKEEQTRELLPDYRGYNHKQLSKMTHLEVFSIDIEALIKQGTIIYKDTYVLFNYNNRNPLNYEAKIKGLR